MLSFLSSICHVLETPKIGNSMPCTGPLQFNKRTAFKHQYFKRIIIGSDRRPETKQGIEGKIDRFRSGKIRVRVRDRVRVRFRSPI